MDEVEPFLDTNVLLYLLSADAAKADRAEALLVAGGVISVQVLNEFANVASRKLGMTWPEIREILAAVRTTCRVEPLVTETHERGIAVAERYGYTVYDGVIIGAAQMAGCKLLLSEDMQDGQAIEDLRITNPFKG